MLHELQRFGLVLIEHRYRSNGSSMTNRDSLTETKEGIGKQYGIVVVRMLVDPANRKISSRSTPCRMR